MHQNHPSTASTLARGFTLIEVMIVVGIIAILAAVAIPSYNDYMVRGRIPDATSQLAGLQVRMEQFYQDRRTYVGANVTPFPCFLDSGTSRFFNFSCTAAPTAAGFTLQAVGKNSMAGFTYTIDQGSARTTTIAAPAPSGWRTATRACWVVKKGDTC